MKLCVARQLYIMMFSHFDVMHKRFHRLKAPVLSHWCIWHVGTTQDPEDTIHSPCDECRSQSNHRMPSSFPPGHWQTHLVTGRRLRLFGHIARSSPQEDHHRAVAAVIRKLAPIGSDC